MAVAHEAGSEPDPVASAEPAAPPRKRSRGWQLIIGLIIQTIRRVPSRSVGIDEAPNLSRADPSGADQIDTEHQSTDLVLSLGCRDAGDLSPLSKRQAMRIGVEDLNADLIGAGREVLLDPRGDGVEASPRDEAVDQAVAPKDAGRLCWLDRPVGGGRLVHGVEVGAHLGKGLAVAPVHYKALELDRCRSVVPSCTRSSRGVAACPVSNFVSIGVTVPSGRDMFKTPVLLAPIPCEVLRAGS